MSYPIKARCLNTAYSVAEWFVHRNNDLDGYWAPGVIKRELSLKGSDKIIYDLLKNNSEPSIKSSAIIMEKINERMGRMLSVNRLCIEELDELTLMAKFIHIDSPNVATRFDVTISIGYGERIWKNRPVPSSCWSHSSIKERRSTRREPYAYFK